MNAKMTVIFSQFNSNDFSPNIRITYEMKSLKDTSLHLKVLNVLSLEDLVAIRRTDEF